MEYLFHTSAYDVERLVPEVSEALARRAALVAEQQAQRAGGLSQRGGSPEKMTRSRLRYRRIVGTALIVLGLIMLIVGAVEREDALLSLIVGVLGIAVGIHSLWGTRKKPEEAPEDRQPAAPDGKTVRKFEATARTFLTNLANVGPTEILLSEQGLHLWEDTVIPYEEMEYFIETGLGYLFTWGRQATFLQKKDLQGGDEDGLRGFAGGRVTCG